MPPLPHFSDVNLLCDGKRVIGVWQSPSGTDGIPPCLSIGTKRTIPKTIFVPLCQPEK
jgi:hypothetical protein